MLDLKINLARELLSRSIPKTKIRVLINFLRYYVRFSDPINNSIFEQEINNITGGTNTMGLEELLLDRAKKEGIREAEIKAESKALEEKKAIAKNLKDKGIDLKIIAEATGLSLEEIQSF